MSALRVHVHGRSFLRPLADSGSLSRVFSVHAAARHT